MKNDTRKPNNSNNEIMDSSVTQNIELILFTKTKTFILNLEGLYACRYLNRSYYYV